MAATTTRDSTGEPRRRRPMHAREYGDASTLGSGDSAVVLLHGQPGHGSVWARVGDLLARRGRYALAVDRPGYGCTGGPAAGFVENAAAVVDLLDRHGIDRATIVAHSWAGGIALALATL